MITKYIFVVIFSVICNCNTLFSQIVFQKAFGGVNDDYGMSGQQTTDGGYIIAGFTHSFGAGNSDFYLIKTDYSGTPLWTKTYGGPYWEYAYAVAQTTDKGYIIAGRSDSSTWPVLVSHLLLVKTDSTGNPQWMKTIEPGVHGEALSLFQTADGGYIIAGYTLEGFVMAYNVIKADSLGNIVWNKIYHGLSSCNGSKIIKTTDGGYVFVGGDDKFGTYEATMTKIDTNGDVLWSASYGGPGNFYDFASSVQQTSDGGFAIIGGTRSFGAGGKDVYLIKTDSAGNLLWSKAYGGQNNDWGYDILQNPDGGYLIVGSCEDKDSIADVYLIRTDALGDLLSTQAIGGMNGEWGQSVRFTDDGGFIIVGCTGSFGAGNSDVYMIKGDSNGYSGCNTVQFTTYVTNAQTFIWNPIITGVPFTAIQNLTTGSSSGCIVTDLCSTVGIDSKEKENSLLVYPNPASTRVVVQLPPGFNNAQLQLFNPLGDKVTEQPLVQSSQAIYLDQPAGFYVIKVSDGNQVLVKKLLIQ